MLNQAFNNNRRFFVNPARKLVRPSLKFLRHSLAQSSRGNFTPFFQFFAHSTIYFYCIMLSFSSIKRAAIHNWHWAGKLIVGTIFNCLYLGNEWSSIVENCNACSQRAAISRKENTRPCISSLQRKHKRRKRILGQPSYSQSFSIFTFTRTNTDIIWLTYTHKQQKA